MLYNETLPWKKDLESRHGYFRFHRCDMCIAKNGSGGLAEEDIPIPTKEEFDIAFKRGWESRENVRRKLEKQRTESHDETFYTCKIPKKDVHNAVDEIKEMKSLLQDFYELVASAGPLAWSTGQYIEDAHEWEKKAAMLLERVGKVGVK